MKGPQHIMVGEYLNEEKKKPLGFESLSATEANQTQSNQRILKRRPK